MVIQTFGVIWFPYTYYGSVLNLVFSLPRFEAPATFQAEVDESLQDLMNALVLV